MKRRKSQVEKFFVIKDVHGVEYATKESLRYLFGVYAIDYKKYFYEVKDYDRKNFTATCDS